MAQEDYAAVARQLGDAATGVADVVQRMHRSIAARPFDALGATAAPVRRLHDGVSDVVYGSIKAGLKAGGSLAAVAATAVAREPLLETPIGRTAAGILTGAFGERVPGGMTLRVDGAEVDVDRAALERAYPDAASHVVLFLHGLIETERWWYPRPGDADAVRLDFGARLAADLGCTPVYLRYHTGRHISDNGRELAALIERLDEQWPVPVRRLSVVGHSMGGLVARSAVHQGVRAAQPWTGRLANVVCLGTPHTGAPLELGAHLLSWALRRMPDTAPLGELLELRSDGIKDLRHGYLHEDDWTGTGTKPQQALVPRGARQHFFTATIARRHDGLIGRLLGDALVTPASSGDDAQEAERHVAGGLHHFDLLHHDDVYQRIRDWLSGLPAAAAVEPVRVRLRDRLRRRSA